MIFLAECHLPFGCIKTHAFHCFDQGVGRSIAVGFFQRSHQGHRSGEATSGKEIRWRFELFVVLGHHGLIHWIFWNTKIIIRRTLHTRKLLISRHCRQDIPPCRNLDVVTLQVHIGNFEGISTSPDDEDDLTPRLILKFVDQALRTCCEISGGWWQKLFMDKFGFFDRLPEGLDPITSKCRVLRQSGDRHAAFIESDRIGDRILRAVAPRPKNIFIPLFARDGISHSRLDQQDFFVFFSDRQHGQCNWRGGGPHRHIRFVITISRRQQALS